MTPPDCCMTFRSTLPPESMSLMHSRKYKNPPSHIEDCEWRNLRYLFSLAYSTHYNILLQPAFLLFSKLYFFQLYRHSHLFAFSFLCNSSLTPSPLPNSNLPLLLPSRLQQHAVLPACNWYVCDLGTLFLCLCLQLQQAWIIPQYRKQLFHP